MVLTGLSTCMGKLYSCQCATRVDEVGNPPKRSDVLIIPDTQILRRDHSVVQYGCSFSHDNAGSPHCKSSQVSQVVITRHSSSTLGGVLAHRRDDDAILKLDSIGQCEWLEEHGLRCVGVVFVWGYIGANLIGFPHRAENKSAIKVKHR
jgi:hypothetical protein